MKTHTQHKNILIFFFCFSFLFSACQEGEQQQKVAENINQNDKTGTPQKRNDSFQFIIGTGWDCVNMYKKGTTPNPNDGILAVYLFCNSGRWEAQEMKTGDRGFIGNIGQMGTFNIEDNRLILIHDGADKLKETYIITWNETKQYLELDDGKMIIRLQNKITARC